MIKRKDRIALAALTLLVGSASSAAAVDLERKLRVATEVYEDFFGRGGGPQNRVVKNAKCIAVIPNVVKGAIGIGGHKGTGVISCREEADWSPPAFVKMSGGSLGLQIGGEASDVVLFFMTRRGVESLLETKFTLGAEAGVAAGPFGSSAEIGTDLPSRAEIYAYARSRGLFAGLSVEGASMTVSQKAIKKYYGERIWPEEILFEHEVPTLPSEARAFMDALPDE